MLDAEAVRARYTALDRRLAFFDGPGGTQCPDEVIDAISRYLREDNANMGAPYETSIRTVELVERAHATAGRFISCDPGEVAFGPSMTSLNFLLTRALGRTLERGDEIVCTQLDHDANFAPWLELAEDLGIVVRFAGVHEDLSLDLDDLEAQLSERTKVVAFPIASNAVGTTPDVTRVVELHTAPARSPGPMPSTTGRTARSMSPAGTSTCCSARRTSSSARTWGWCSASASCSKACGPTRCARPQTSPWDGGSSTARCSTLLAGFVAAVEYIESLGWEAIVARERQLGARFLDGLPQAVELYGLRTMEGRVPTFAFNLAGRTSEEVATSSRRARSRSGGATTTRSRS